jgi:hypothetical protein
LTPATRSSTDGFASPNSIFVFSFVKSGFGMPAKPAPRPLQDDDVLRGVHVEDPLSKKVNRQNAPTISEWIRIAFRDSVSKFNACRSNVAR